MVNKFLPPCSRTRLGFNLIESAIVLGIIGLVIGGIWYAAAAVIQNQRVNDTATSILQIANNARRLFPISSYPTVSGTDIAVTSTAFAAGAIPGDFKYVSGAYATSPMGAQIGVYTSCWSRCPMLGLIMRGPYSPAIPSTMTTSDCVQIIRRFAGLEKDNKSNLFYVQVAVQGNAGFLFLFPPFDPALVNCPANTTDIAFWFNP
jgi:type II secretory pathway pseudopilin PulG